MISRAPLILSIVLLLASCGREKGDECISQEAKILQCRADLAASRYYSTEYQLRLDFENCQRWYPIKQCY